MIPGLAAAVEKAVAEACLRLFDVEVHRVIQEVPPKAELGDIALPIAFELAKRLKRPPRKLADELAPALQLPAAIERRAVQGGGYINLFVNRAQAMSELLKEHAAGSSPAGKLIIEHTNINPNKAAHIGHLRNAVLGDVLVKTFRSLGRNVEVQNYIDDTGVQLADVVVGLLHGPRLSDPERAAALAAEIDELLAVFPNDLPGVLPRRLGDLAWDLYALVGRSYAEAKTRGDGSLEEDRRHVLHAIEGAALGNPLSEKDAAIAKRAGRLAEAVVRCHLLTMARIGVSYDLLPHESDILAHRFWSRAFELLKDRGAAELESSGKNAGCWVLRLAGSPEFEGMEDADKILLRSNGTVTYTGKDIAYQLWKLGVLGIDFEYEEVPYRDMLGNREFVASDGEAPLYRTRRSADGADPSLRGRFGHAEGVINVIDVRQSYPQKVVREAVRRAGYPDAARRSVHFAYEMVALTPASAELMGIELSDEDRKRPFIEMSGRKGLGIKADDLLERLVEKARDQVALRSGGEPVEPARAEAIAIGALRVYMTRFSRNTVIAFDFEEALAFEGDTGPYLQYAAVRATNVFRKLEASGHQGLLGAEDIASLEGAERSLFDDGLWEAVRLCGQTQDTIVKVGESLEVSLLVRHAHAIASAFHKLYNTHSVLKAPDVGSRLVRRAVFQAVLLHLTRLLAILGVPVPERM